MTKKEIKFEIETDKDDEMLKVYLKYSLRALQIKNINIFTEVDRNGKTK